MKRVKLESPNSHYMEHPGFISRRSLHATATSIGSATALEALETPQANVADLMVRRVEQCHRDFFNSKDFAKDLREICRLVRPLLRADERCITLPAPAHVLGDIHGNIEDLLFFAETIWRNGVQLTPGKIIFLGDYVDRGPCGLECVAYLFSLKILCPSKVFLLRGNHELRSVNGWVSHYGDASFLSQCRSRFGDRDGCFLWETVNQTFDCLPLAAVVGEDVFCVHGGPPKPRWDVSQIEAIREVQRSLTVDSSRPGEDPVTSDTAHQCIWSDPGDERRMDEQGYCPNPRGGGTSCFGQVAVDTFLKAHGLSCIVRAHEKTGEGLAISKGGRVLTVFSTSKDHSLGEEALAACLLVDDGRIHVITKAPNYGLPSLPMKAPAGASCSDPAWLEEDLEETRDDLQAHRESGDLPDGVSKGEAEEANGGGGGGDAGQTQEAEDTLVLDFADSGGGGGSAREPVRGGGGSPPEPALEAEAMTANAPGARGSKKMLALEAYLVDHMSKKLSVTSAPAAGAARTGMSRKRSVRAAAAAAADVVQA